MAKRSTATIKDVASSAGVSPSTVHYVLNGQRSISPAVRQRVLDAVQALNYTASSLGQRLSKGRSHSIGMVAPQLPPGDAAVMEMLAAAAATASAADHTLGIFVGQSPEQMLQLLHKQFVDGVLLVETTHLDPRIEALRGSAYPFVLIGQTGRMEGLSAVDFDFEAATYAAFEHLVVLGHRRIGFIAPEHPGDPNLENRFALEHGFARAQASLNFRCLRRDSRLDIEGGYVATQDLLNASEDITAIVATGHTHAGVLRALYGRHLRVPDDCSVVGITTAQVADWTTPRLSSVDIPLSRMSALATELLLRKLAGESLAEQVVMPAELVVRETSGPPRR